MFPLLAVYRQLYPHNILDIFIYWTANHVCTVIQNSHNVFLCRAVANNLDRIINTGTITSFA